MLHLNLWSNELTTSWSRRKSMTKGRWKVIACVALVLAMVMSACASDDTTGTTQPGETTTSAAVTPIKIGIPLALTGPIAYQADEMRNAYNLYLDQHGGKLGGIPVELLFEDTEADPNMVISKTRKLITNDQVHFLGGGALALESLAMIDVAVENNIAYVTPMSSADDLTQRNLKPIFARTNMTSSQPNLYFGQWAAEQGYKKVAIVAQDYAYGWESAGGFQYGFEQSGGEVVQKLYVPLDNSDITPFVRQIDESVDAVYAILIGSFVPQFVKAYQEFGLRDTIPLIGGPDMADEDALKAMGDEEVGLVIVHEYAASIPAAQQFVTDYEAAFGAIPSYWAESTYSASMFFDKAIAKAKVDNGLGDGEVADWIRNNPEAFIDAIVAVEVPDAPRGDLKLDEYHNVIVPAYVFEVTAPDTKEIIHDFGTTTQFWTETPEEFLAHPAFSREFP